MLCEQKYVTFGVVARSRHTLKADQLTCDAAGARDAGRRLLLHAVFHNEQKLLVWQGCKLAGYIRPAPFMFESDLLRRYP